MRIDDLDILTGPVLVFGGPYSNLPATMAIKAVAGKLNITPENIICTGDTVAYCAEPEQTVQLIKDWGITVIEGNCEESFGNNLNDCGCGFEAGTRCDLLSAQWYRYAASQLSEGSRQWLRTRPQQVRFMLAGKSFAVIHGSYQQNNQFIFASTPEEAKRHDLEQAGTDGIIAGHCGLPFHQRVENKIWLNPGVIGMPANDGSADGWYALLKPTAHSIQITLHRLDYNAEQARNTMLSNGLTAGYQDTLTSGLWPVQDVLPVREKKQQGKNLQFKTLLL